MLKYVDTAVTFSEIPDEITLCINISNCPCKCKNCHSSYLAEDIGEILTITRIEKLIEKNKGITTVCFMGGDSNPKLINHYAKCIKNLYTEKVISEITLVKDIDIPKKNIHIPKGEKCKVSTPVKGLIKVAWYSGRQELSKDIDLENFDYIKLGPYIEELGPLNSRTTNQRMYKIDNNCGKPIVTDITSRFWK